MTNSRIGWIDTFRGVVVISMILYHSMWDLVYLHGLNVSWYPKLPGYIWQQSICWSFILLSGFCFNIGKRPLRRGLTIFLCGAIVSAVTILFVPEAGILFGVMTFIGSAMILTALLDVILKRLFPAVGIGIFAILFLLSRDVNTGYIGFESLRLLKIPEGLYRNIFSTFLGFPVPGFASADYFSIVPWLFLFLVGYYIGKIYFKEHLPTEPKVSTYHRNRKKSPNPFAFIGRHSLWFYMAHQPVVYLLFTVIFKFI